MSEQFQNSGIEPILAKALKSHSFKAFFLRVVPADENVSRDLSEALEFLNPLYVSTTSDELRQAIEKNLISQTGHPKIASKKDAEGIVLPIIKTCPAIAVVLATHGSGYVREVAVRSIRSIDGPFALALMIARLNDWVPAVRLAASSKLEALLREVKVSPAAVRGCMELLTDGARNRRASDFVRDATNQLLEVPGVQERVRLTILSSKRDDAPQTLKAALRWDWFDEQLENVFQNAQHKRASAIAFEALLTGQVRLRGSNHTPVRTVNVSVDRKLLAISGMNHRSVQIRRIALDYISASDFRWDGDVHALLKAAEDKALSVAGRATFELRRREIEFLEPFKDRAKDNPRDFDAVRVLSRFGTRDFAEQIYTTSQLADGRIRIEFLSAAMRLGHSSARDELKKMVMSAPDRPAVRRAAKVLQSAGESLTYAELMAMLENKIDLRTRGAFQSISMLPPMKMACVIAEMSDDPDNERVADYWRLLAKKRLIGAFLPDSSEVDELIVATASKPMMAARFEAVLGIRLGRVVRLQHDRYRR